MGMFHKDNRNLSKKNSIVSIYTFHYMANVSVFPTTFRKEQ